MIPENIRFMLSQYKPTTSLYFGHRFAVQHVKEGYMAGGGYILSKHALEKFVTRILPNETLCRSDEGGSEDLEMGKCLEHFAIAVDVRDNLQQERFFPVSVEQHMKKDADPEYWYVKNQYYDVPQGSPRCCSDTPAGFHYIPPREMYALQYFIRHVHPFGLQQNVTEKIPPKLTLKEILRASDAESSSANFEKHSIQHHFDKLEIYK